MAYCSLLIIIIRGYIGLTHLHTVRIRCEIGATISGANTIYVRSVMFKQTQG